MIEISVTGRTETMKSSDQVFAVFEPVIGQRGEPS